MRPECGNQHTGEGMANFGNTQGRRHFVCFVLFSLASVSNSHQHSTAWRYATEISASMILSSKIFESSHGFIIIRMPLSRFRTNRNQVCLHPKLFLQRSHFYETIFWRSGRAWIMEKHYSHQHKWALQVLASVHEYSRFLYLFQMAPWRWWSPGTWDWTWCLKSSEMPKKLKVATLSVGHHARDKPSTSCPFLDKNEGSCVTFKNTSIIL